jgi:Zn-dependent metalloprotease
MNEDEVQMDVSAETKLFNPSLMSFEENKGPEATVQPDLPLPKSIPYEASNIEIPKDIKMDVSDKSLGLEVKFDAESSYNELKTSVENLQSSLTSMHSDQYSQNLPSVPRAVNNFEEKPTLDQTNLIFEERRTKFSQYPKWA